MKMKRHLVGVIALCFTVLSLVSGCAELQNKSPAQVPKMTKEALKARLDDPAIRVIDVRVPKSWGKSTSKIKGAIRENPEEVLTWFQEYSKDKTIVLYCS